MITHLVDSDWLIDFLGGRSPALETLSRLMAQQAVATTFIVCGEIYDCLIDEPGRATAFENLLGGIDVLGPDDDTARIFGQQRAALRRYGNLIPDHDVWLASVALRHDLTLLTRDRHFRRVPGLKLG